MTATAAAPQAA